MLAEIRLGAWQQRFQGCDDGIRLGCEAQPLGLGPALSAEEQALFLAFLLEARNGIQQMSTDFPGVVETSDNMGVACLEQGEWRVTFKVRSLKDERANDLADEIIGHAASCLAQADKSGAYPGWSPNLASPLLEVCQQVYLEEFSQSASLQVIHAGLECGLLAASHPQLDMISFGPNIRGAHAPGERVEADSVERCWRLLRAVLQALSNH